MLLEQAICQTVDCTQAIKALDLCAAPGGKSTHLLSLLSDSSLVVANEVIGSRASILSENIQKWGYGNTIITNNDPSDFTHIKDFFDVIVIDAPCSGEGLFRKDKHARQEWSPENVALCALRQQRIITDVWPALKENGILIYSTCTYNEKENEDNLNWLQQQHALQFIPLSLDASWGVEETRKGNAIGYRCMPHVVQGEGFFISVMRKTEVQNQMSIRQKNLFQLASKKTIEPLAHWLMPSEITYILKGDLLVAVPSPWLAEFEFISKHLKAIAVGTAVAVVKQNKLVPEHALALSTSVNKNNFTCIDVDLATALNYLRKNPIALSETKKGFALLFYQNVCIGWVNILDNRVNNLYPANWRIRMS